MTARHISAAAAESRLGLKRPAAPAAAPRLRLRSDRNMTELRPVGRLR